MPKKPAKQLPADVNRRAASVVAIATGTASEATVPEKNPAAVALGRLGGLRGGKARAAKLSPERRSEIAREAARKRHGPA